VKVPISWIREYVDTQLSPKQLAHSLTMVGLESQTETIFDDGWDNICVAKVTGLQQHPNADRLTLATLDIGNENITVVCGAKNLLEGQRVVFAKPGARLIDPENGRHEVLKVVRIRGIESAGMICSKRELGLGEDHTGILILDKGAPTGAPLSDYMRDVVIETEPTTNRPDWLSVLGVAHEVAAITKGEVCEPESNYLEHGPAIQDRVIIRVEAPDLSPRYTASLITGIKIRPSPWWLQERLLKAGQKSINNIVDVTNYVMLEYGQPLHAFDYDLLEQSTILVRRGRFGETITTLDGELRELTPEMLVIADASRAIGLAGVIGGANTEITEGTTSVLLESAKFDAVNIRRTATALKIRTEASTRFERNINGDLASFALMRATHLIQELGGGQVAQGIIDLDNRGSRHDKVSLNIKRVEDVLGIRLSLKKAKGILSSLGFICEAADSKSILVTIPYWRSDIRIQDDLVEELARIYGYDNIPTRSLSQEIPTHQPQLMRTLSEQIKDLLSGVGMQETISYSLTSYEVLSSVDSFDLKNEPLQVSNPMTPERQYLRNSLSGNVLNTLTNNLRHEEFSVGLFEVGRIYIPHGDDLPSEHHMAVGVLWGNATGLSWAEDSRRIDFYDGKGVLETIFRMLGKEPHFQQAEAPIFHPGRTALVFIDDVKVGIVGEVHPEVLEAFHISSEEATVLFEVDLEALLPLVEGQDFRFTPFTRFPGAYRDLALVSNTEVPAAKLKEIIETHNLVQTATVFDVYTGSKVTKGERSLTFRVHFQSLKDTLNTETVNKAQEEILQKLEKEVGGQQR